MKIKIHIEDLVFERRSPGKGNLGSAVERVLHCLLVQHGLPLSLANAGQIPRLNGGTIKVKPDGKAAEVGGQIANAVYRGFCR